MTREQVAAAAEACGFPGQFVPGVGVVRGRAAWLELVRTAPGATVTQAMRELQIERPPCSPWARFSAMPDAAVLVDDSASTQDDRDLAAALAAVQYDPDGALLRRPRGTPSQAQRARAEEAIGLVRPHLTLPSRWHLLWRAGEAGLPFGVAWHYRDRDCYFVALSTCTPFDCIRRTVAHELQHLDDFRSGVHYTPEEMERRATAFEVLAMRELFGEL